MDELSEKEIVKHKAEQEARKAEEEHIREEIRKKRAKEPLDAFMEILKAGNKIKFGSDCYKLHDIENDTKFHGEVLELDKFEYVPDKETKDKYSGKSGTFWFVKVKDIIGKDTFWSLAELLIKV